MGVVVAVGVGVGVGVCVDVGVGVGVAGVLEELLELLSHSVVDMVICPVLTTPRILITAVVNTNPPLPRVTPVITVVV